MIIKAKQRESDDKGAFSDDEGSYSPSMRRSRSWDAASFLPFDSAGKRKTGRKLGTGWPFRASKRRTVLIATMECAQGSIGEQLMWTGTRSSTGPASRPVALTFHGLAERSQVKIGGLGVMSSLMGKALDDCDLYWIVPKV